MFNCLDYGAVGTGAQTPIGNSLGANLTVESLAAYVAPDGTTPFAWATNPALGLRFTMTTTAAQPASNQLVFLLVNTSADQGTWKGADIPTWMHPKNGNCLIKVGLGVSGPGIPAGTVISEILATQFTVSDNGAGPADVIPWPTGTLVLSQTTPAVSEGTEITFEVQPADLQARTLDWLGIQASLANAAAIKTGAKVYWPGRNYQLNAPLLNPAYVMDPTFTPSALTVMGDGDTNTQLHWFVDLGFGVSALGLSTRGHGQVISCTDYRDFRLVGPSGRITFGVAPCSMGGLELGITTRCFRIRSEGFRTGFDLIGDHNGLYYCVGSDNGYGLYFAPFSDTIGNQAVEHCSFTANWCASIAFSTTNQLDSAVMRDVHTGFGPFGFYLEPVLPGVQSSNAGWLSNSHLDSVWIEAIGREWIHGYNGTGEIDTMVLTNIIALASLSDNNHSTSNGEGGVFTATSLVTCGLFQNIKAVGCIFGAYSLVSEAMFVCSGPIDHIDFDGDPSVVISATQAIPTFKSPADINWATFRCSQFEGRYRRLLDNNLAVGTPLYDDGLWVDAYQDGKSFAGVLMAPTAALTYGAVATSGYYMTAAVADSSQTFYGSQGVFPTSTPNVGFAGAVDQAGCAAIFSEPSPDNVNIKINLGVLPNATRYVQTGVAGSGDITISATTTQFASVAAGTTAKLPPYPVGTSLCIYNDGANPITVEPYASGTFVAGGNQVAAGSMREIVRTGSTTYR